MVCVSFFFFSFCIRIWQALAIHRIAGKEEEIVIFLVFYFHPLTNSHLVHRDFNHFSTFFPRSICNNQTDSWWHLFSLEICILFEFLLMLISGSYWLCHFKVTLWGFELISNYYLSITKQMPEPTEIYTLRYHCLSITATQLYSHPPFILYPFAKMYKKWKVSHFFTRDIFTDIFTYINIKRVFQIEIDHTRCNWNPKMLEYNKTHMFLLFQHLKNSTSKKKWRKRLFKLDLALFIYKKLASNDDACLGVGWSKNWLFCTNELIFLLQQTFPSNHHDATLFAFLLFSISFKP